MFQLLSIKLNPEVVSIILGQFFSLQELIDFGLADSTIISIKRKGRIEAWLEKENTMLDSECQDIVERPVGEGLVPWFASLSSQEFKFLHSNFRSKVLKALNHTPDWQNVFSLFLFSSLL
jgi:hypothetical protein